MLLELPKDILLFVPWILKAPPVLISFNFEYIFNKVWPIMFHQIGRPIIQNFIWKSTIITLLFLKEQVLNKYY